MWIKENNVEILHKTSYNISIIKTKKGENMLIKQSIIQNLCKEAGQPRSEKAKKYPIKKKV